MKWRCPIIMKKSFIYAIAIISLTISSQAFSYNTALGLRFGPGIGFSIKHFTRSDVALEGIVHSLWHGFAMTGLYEVHARAFNVQGLYWYYGGGGHIGFWDGHYDPYWHHDRTAFALGIDGIIGMEYNIPEIPINLSLDFKPAFNIIPYFGFLGYYGDGFGFSIRYRF